MSVLPPYNLLIEFVGKDFGIKLLLEFEYTVKLIHQVGAVECRYALFITTQEFVDVLSGSKAEVVHFARYIHTVNYFALFRRVGFSRALIATLFVDRQQHACQLDKLYSFRNCLCTQMQGFECGTSSVFRQNIVVGNKAMCFQHLDQCITAHLIALTIASHSAF